ncbi:pyrroloquinoline quinone-dependent dehydrogenase [Sphingomonas crocodyli]|uniref:Pyrroloquinoline quinone-dependent dehydrogenase n=1 Tax=Sphingomonas crocodyli TaxID=1979270 RepID=A0A437M7Y1_9SPHN|nr:pyrroloquinoline quinone-dependent dehydrogenase [Sphingomonas crocodyli]RVT93604.1 pyrroloquinoline quinone-dependent dehydrogenase [Sphingomonas crocodyli]
MHTPPTGFRIVLSALLILAGLWLTIGGALLIMAGGGIGTAIAGATTIGAGWAYLRHPAAGVALLFLTIAVAAIATIRALGFDAWALLPIAGLPGLFGLIMLISAIRRRATRLMLIAGIVVAVGGLTLWLVRPPQAPAGAGAPAPDSDWPLYGRSPDGSRRAPDRQITPANVGALEIAWSYRTGETYPGSTPSFEATPIRIGDRLVFCTPDDDVIALDPVTGRQVWRHDVGIDGALRGNARCRGVSYHRSATAGACAERILIGTMDARLIALDLRDGKLCRGFGRGGQVDLTEGLGPIPAGMYTETSPPAVIGDIVVLGGGVKDGVMVDGASGVIRAFDAIDGHLVWAWDLAHPQGRRADGIFTRGTPNAWAPIGIDPALGQFLVPLGSSTPDFVGTHRSAASNRYATSLVAIDARTGRERWHFQTVHHDLWDYDLSSPPLLVDWPAGGRNIPAAIFATKTGAVFVLDRRTGTPLTRVIERPVPRSDFPGESAAPTQPLSIDMPALGRQRISGADIWGTTPFDQLWCRIAFYSARYEGPFTPPSVGGSITVPSSTGGVNWGGLSYDPERRLVLANWGNLAVRTHLIDKGETGAPPAPIAALPGVQPDAGIRHAALPQIFLSPLGIPCTRPPFGEIGAIDLKTRRLAWSRPLGTMRDSGPFGLRSGLAIPMGVPNMGGTITTAGGLTFVGATQDAYLRAFATADGRELWRARLPAGAQATPISYSAGGRQYVVIAAGGSALLQSKPGDWVIAFALPKR